VIGTYQPENIAMKQHDLGLNLSTRRTRKMELLELMPNQTRRCMEFIFIFLSGCFSKKCGQDLTR
jgi:hypothetical protein